MTYYSNSVATRRLLLSGDVEENPGPLGDQSKQNKRSKPSKPAKCPQCTRSVQSNHKRYLCTVCYDLCHAKCSTLPVCIIKNVRATEPQEWICDKCHLSTLPFYQCTQDEFIANYELSAHNTTHNSSNGLRQDEHGDALNSRPNQLKIIHLNTQSMVSTFDELLVTIKEYPFDVIAMSETWLKDNPHLLNYVTIPGYSQVFRNREKIRGGGVGFYIREGIMFKRRMDIENVEPDLEHIWLEVDGRNRHSKMLLGVIYRSESMDNFSSWIEKTENLLSHLTTIWDGLLVLTGDMNVDLGKPNATNAKQYTDMLESFNLHQHVNKPTRITSTSQTLIDHIISNMPNRITHCDVLPCPTISDHDAPYACINVRVCRFEPRYKFLRNEKRFNEQLFVEDFSMLPLDIVYGIDDPDEKLEIFTTMFKSCLGKHAPLRRVKITRPPAPWLNTDDIRQLQKERDRLRQLAHKTNPPSTNVWSEFREVRNKIKTKIKKVKRCFYEKVLSSRKPKELWQTIHRLLHPNPQPIRADPNLLNKHFSSTSQRLLNSKPNTPDELHNLINSLPPNCNTDTFNLRFVTYNEVLNNLKSMRSDCSTGVDQIPVKFLKPVADLIASPLTHIINSFISCSSFPTAWKIGRISPIPKIDQPTESDHYRPISILPVLSKVFERLILQQMSVYLNQQDILQKSITGFRKGHSTSTVLLRIRDDIIKAMKKGEVTLIAFADFSKAFDTVDYSIVLRKLHAIGFSPSSLNWVLNYLTSRKQFVQINDKQSDLESVHFGIPQGSILGPVLFNLYVNDLQGTASGCCCFQYADDTTVYNHCSPKDLRPGIQNITNTIRNLELWAADSNLLLNGEKTKQMLVTSPQMSRIHDLGEIVPPVVVKGRKLNRVKIFKLLGTWFNEHLKWSDHVKKVVSSCYGVLSTLRKVKNMAPQNTKKQIAESLVLSKLGYNDVVTYPLPVFLQKKIQRVQNAAASFVTNRYSTEKDVVKLGWLPTLERAQFNLLKSVYKSMYNPLWPKYLPLEMHETSRCLRSSAAPQLAIPLMKNTFQDSAATLFNNLPANIRSCIDEHCFNRQIRTILMNNAKERLTS